MLFQISMYVGAGHKWTSNPVTLTYILYYLVLVMYGDFVWLRFECLSKRKIWNMQYLMISEHAKQTHNLK